MKYKVCLLSNENTLDHLKWVDALSKSDLIDFYDIVNLTSDAWLERIRAKEYDLILLRPPGRTELFKRLYDERVTLLNQYFDIPIYPSVLEVLLYENKRFLRDWLMVNQLPHPETHVFFDRDEALSFIHSSKEFPIMGKTNIGASGNGVKKLNEYAEAVAYVSQAFEQGIKPRIGPKLKKGSPFKKVLKVFRNKGFLRQRLRDYKSNFINVQFHYVILQKFVPHSFEWRCVRIGESYFAHKKIVVGDMASGTLKKGYDKVPETLLNFMKSVTEKHNLSSVAIDIFEEEGNYLINEIQYLFGQSDPYQMLVNGKPGRYIYENDSWGFQEGMFNTNENYDLRLVHALTKLKNVE